MSNALIQTPHLKIDGKMVSCLPGEEFGSIGMRYLCILGQTPGQPSKKLLVRNMFWTSSQSPLWKSPAESSNNSEFVNFCLSKCPTRIGLAFAQAIVKNYEQHIIKGNKSIENDEWCVFEPNIRA